MARIYFDERTGHFSTNIDKGEQERMDDLYQNFKRARQQYYDTYINPDPDPITPKEDPDPKESVELPTDPGYLAIRHHYREAIIYKLSESSTPNVSAWYCPLCKITIGQMVAAQPCFAHAFLIEVIDVKFEMI